MLLNIILLILLVLGLGILVWLVWNKWPQLRILDTKSLPQERSKQLKHQIIRRRVERVGGKHIGTLQKSVVNPVGIGIQSIFRRIAGKLTAVERRYQERQKQTDGGKFSKESLHELIEEGKKLLADELWDRAEKKFIDVIGADSKNIEAYEQLGRLYLQKKDFESAKETFQFLSKLSKKDPSVIASLGEVEELMGDKKAAFAYYEQAVTLSPKNPKYLDFAIESAIEIGLKHEAMSLLDKLRSVNPENKKIEVYEAKISKDIKKKKEKK